MLSLNNVFSSIKNISVRHLSTIFAVSSGRGKCGVAVVRVSGPNARMALQLLTCSKPFPKPRYAYLKEIKHPKNGEVLDKGIVIWFPGPKSFTGEDSCEFQIHGGYAVISAVLDALASIDNLRLAEPGEFTKRAFYNGKLDLTEVEGISDLLSAETDVQRKQAFLQSQGSLRMVYEKWQETLVKCLANIEAHIDFAETETIEEGLLQKVAETVKKLSNDISAHLEDGLKGERLRNGVRTVILGEPNVGKSSIFNLLCQRPAAIVTPIEGTTRDVLETTLDINGYPLILTDTAGLRSNTEDVIEQEGIRRALEAFNFADLILLVVDFNDYQLWQKHCQSSFLNYLKHYAKKLNISELLNNCDDNIFIKPTIPVINKADLFNVHDGYSVGNVTVPVISCKAEYSICSLLQEITKKMRFLCGEPSEEHPNMNQMRHRQYLILCLQCLQKFSLLMNNNMDMAVMAEQLRKAVQQLGKISGRVTTEELLSVIFKGFCIGK